MFKHMTKGVIKMKWTVKAYRLILNSIDGYLGIIAALSTTATRGKLIGYSTKKIRSFLHDVHGIPINL